MTKLLPEFPAIGAGDNNALYPTLDPVAGSPERAIAPANFAPGTTDGLVDGPNPRTISNDVAGATNDPTASDETEDETYSAWLYTFGQFVDHDLDLEAVGDIDISIPMPDGDTAHGSIIPLTRATTDPATHTVVNQVTGLLDLSQVYGSDATRAASLRNPDGMMKTSEGDALPIKPGTPPVVPGAGAEPKPDSFVAGDDRVNENPELAAVTTLFVREHNYWVGQLSRINPGWSGDQLYNMAKAIVTAEYQNIVYSQYLPALIGGDSIPSYSGYDPTVNPQITQEFSTAAFRVGHSQVSDEQTQIDNNGNVVSKQSLADSFASTPATVTANDGIDGLLRNMSSDASQAVDVYAVDGLRNLLLATPDVIDLIAIDIQRERDLGIGTLNQTRQALGMRPYTSWDQLTSDPWVRSNLETTYGDIQNVDLFIGGIAEDHASGAVVGPTFQAIIAQQFTALRDGDRFFWQNETFDNSLKTAIENTTLGDIIERNTATGVEQQNVFLAQKRHTSDTPVDDPDDAQLIIGVDDDNAMISGGAGDDTIVAGLGLSQVLMGGGGSNVFVYDGSGHDDRIADFDPSRDKIEFQPSTDKEMKTVFQAVGATVSISDFAGGASVKFDNNTIELMGVDAGSLGPSNFLFTYRIGSGDPSPREMVRHGDVFSKQEI